MAKKPLTIYNTLYFIIKFHLFLPNLVIIIKTNTTIFSREKINLKPELGPTYDQIGQRTDRLPNRIESRYMIKSDREPIFLDVMIKYNIFVKNKE